MKRLYPSIVIAFLCCSTQSFGQNQPGNTTNPGSQNPLGSSGSASGSMGNTVLGPYSYYFSDQQPYDLTQPIVHGSVPGCADEGRIVNIKLVNINGPITVTPDHANVVGPGCPTYDDHGNRHPAEVQPPNCEDFTGQVFVTQQPGTGIMTSGSFTAKDDGHWTTCSTGQQHQFPQTVTLLFQFYGIDCRVNPDTIVCNNGVAYLDAIVWPSGGILTWSTPFGNFTGNHVPVNLPGNFVSGMVTATYSIGGASKNSSGIIEVGKLTSFTLPKCVTTTDVTQGATVTDSVATTTFDGVCHPKVTYNPAKITTGFGQQTTDVTVNATAGPVTLAAKTIAVNPNKAKSYDIEQMNWFVYVKNFGKIVNMMEQAFAFTGKFAVSPCVNELSNHGLTTGGNISYYKLCCDGAVKDGSSVAVTFGYSYGQNCHFPIPGASIPGIASIDAVVKWQVGISGTVSAASTCGKDELCINGKATGSVGGGVGCSLAAGFVRAELTLNVDGAGLSCTACRKNGVWQAAQPPCSLCTGDLTISGSVTTAWCVTNSVSYTLMQGFCKPVNIF